MFCFYVNAIYLSIIQSRPSIPLLPLEALIGNDAVSAARWAGTSKWLGLTVLNSCMDGNDRGFVEFVARFSHEGQSQEIHENSEFHRIEGAWYYVDGQLFSDGSPHAVTRPKKLKGNK